MLKKFTLVTNACWMALGALALSLGAHAQSTDTLTKVKTSGEIVMGVRDSSGALSYTLGDGKYLSLIHI